MTDSQGPARWAELEPLLDAALERPPEERDAFVANVAVTDPELSVELSALLRDASRLTALPLLDQSAGAVFASLLKEDPEVVARALEKALTGRYTILKKLGAGGMATVYLAHDIQHDRKVALKVLHPDLSHTVGAERFTREVRLVSTLEHDHIVGVFDSGEADGHLWFTMPFIEGESLRERINRVGQLPLDETLAIFREAASALAFAHARGVIHRDIKPDNIMLADGKAFVADFGIARAIESSGEALTVTGTSVGTPAYMAPEQAAGEKNLTERVDIYALGSVLYEMLAGATAFTGPSVQAIIVRAMTTDPAPIHPIRTAVTPALDAVILKAMSRTPADRFASMTAFSEAVATAAVSTAGAPQKSVLRRPMVRVALAAGAVAVLATIAVMSVTGREPPRLAVLPFENRSADTTDAYLADGFTEELGYRVARVPQLAVVSNSAVRRLGSTGAMSMPEIGRVLGASFLMSGSVQRVGGRLRVSVELARASNGEQVWAERYDRAESELPLLMRDIAVATATGMLGSLKPDALAELTAPTENSAAYDLYLRGSKTRFDEGAAGLQQSIASFEGALALDPRFAAAQARLAGVYARALMWNVPLPGMPVDTVLARAAAAAASALALDSASADAWQGRGTVLFFGQQDYVGAVAAVGRAAALDSTNAAVHWMQGQILRRLGDFAGAEVATRRALVADPRFAVAYNQMAIVAFSQRRLSEALALSDSAIALDTTHWQFAQIRARVHMALGDTARARQDAELSVRLSPPAQNDYAEMILAQAEWMSGDTARARRRLVPVLAEIPVTGTLTPRFYQVAVAQIAIGRRDDGLATLERIRPRGAWLWSYLVMPSFDAVRSDPRFVKLVEESRPPGARGVP